MREHLITCAVLAFSGAWLWAATCVSILFVTAPFAVLCAVTLYAGVHTLVSDW